MKKILALLSFVALMLPNIALAVYNPTGGGTYRLQTSVGLADTSIRLSSFKEPVSNIPYTMSYLNSDLECGTLDPQTSRSEFIQFTGITQNSDGTAILTGVTRGLGRSYPYTASSTLRQTHAGQSIFILSDAPCLFNQYGIKQNDETLTGYWDVPTPLSDDNIANKSYVDSLVNGGAVSNARLVAAGTAGETLAAGDIIAYRKSDGEWYLADNDSPNFLVDSTLGIAQGAGTDGNAITGGVLLEGLDTNQSALSAGQRYFISGTAGDLTTSTTTIMVGQARSTTNLYVNFQQANPYYFGGVGYTFPALQASASSTALLNDGSGSLTWNGVSQAITASSSAVYIGNTEASTTVLMATIPANIMGTGNVFRATVEGILLGAQTGERIFVEVGYGNATTTLNFSNGTFAQSPLNLRGNLNFFMQANGTGAQKNSLDLNLSSSISTSTIGVATSTSAIDSTVSQTLTIIMKTTGGSSYLGSFFGFAEMLRR